MNKNPYILSVILSLMGSKKWHPLPLVFRPVSKKPRHKATKKYAASLDERKNKARRKMAACSRAINQKRG